MMDTRVDIGEVNRVLKGFRGKWKANEPMCHHTTWRIGGPADIYAIPMDPPDLALLINNCADMGIPWMVIGNGSNVLVADGGIRGVVIHLSQGFNQKVLDGNCLEAGAACRLPGLARYTAKNGLRGLEFAAGIPASLGGAVVMNAGAHGCSMAVIVKWVDVIDAAGRLKQMTHEDLEFQYRHSRLQRDKAVVIRVGMELQPDHRDAIEKDMEYALAKRKASQPLEWPNAGSVFLNPPGDSAGRLIEKTGLKGFTLGGAQVSTRHANFIINTGGAKAADVLSVMAEVRNRVLATCGVELQSEVRVIGDTRGAG